MDTDRIKGAAQEVGGKVQQGFGKITGDSSMQAEGAAREMGGKAQGLFGEARIRFVTSPTTCPIYARDVVDHGGEYARKASRPSKRVSRTTRSSTSLPRQPSASSHPCFSAIRTIAVITAAERSHRDLLLQ